MQDKKQIYYDYFQQKIFSEVQSFEIYRKKFLFKSLIVSIFLFLAGIVFAVSFIFLLYSNVISPIILPFLLFFMYVSFLKSITTIIYNNRRFKDYLSEKLFPLFLTPIANFKKWPKNQNTETILNSKLFANFDTQEDNYSYFGVYNNANIILSDTKLTLPIKASIKPALFKGIMVQLELPKSVSNHIILISKNENKCNNYKNIKVNIKDLEDYLNVFAKNKNLGGIVSQEFWNVIKKIGSLYCADGFLMSVQDNILLIAMRRKNPLRFGSLFESLLNAKNYDELIGRFTVIYEMIDILCCSI